MTGTWRPDLHPVDHDAGSVSFPLQVGDHGHGAVMALAEVERADVPDAGLGGERASERARGCNVLGIGDRVVGVGPLVQPEPGEPGREEPAALGLDLFGICPRRRSVDV